LKVIAADIGNAYLHAKTNEMLYTILGDDYGELSGKVLVFDKGLYGLRSSGARFHEHLSDILRKIGLMPSKARLNLWFKECGTHYKYLARYVDDILVFSKDPMRIIECLKVPSPLQGVGLPEYYFGGDFKIQERDKGGTITVCARTYIGNVCQRVEELFNIQLMSDETPIAADYHPEMGDSGSCIHDDCSRYLMLIGCGQWTVTLERFDVMYATQTMAIFSAAPKQEHLKECSEFLGM